MEGVEQVRQIDDSHLHWVAEVGGKTKEWDAEIVDQVPDRKISWRSVSGSRNSGVVCFRPKDPQHTEVSLELYYEPENLKEKAGDWLGILSSKVEGDLERFRDFIEERPAETGAWRGKIRAKRVERRDGANTTRGAVMGAAPEYDASGKSGLP